MTTHNPNNKECKRFSPPECYGNVWCVCLGAGCETRPCTCPPSKNLSQGEVSAKKRSAISSSESTEVPPIIPPPVENVNPTRTCLSLSCPERTGGECTAPTGKEKRGVCSECPKKISHAHNTKTCSYECALARRQRRIHEKSPAKEGKVRYFACGEDGLTVGEFDKTPDGEGGEEIIGQFQDKFESDLYIWRKGVCVNVDQEIEDFLRTAISKARAEAFEEGRKSHLKDCNMLVDDVVKESRLSVLASIRENVGEMKDIEIFYGNPRADKMVYLTDLLQFISTLEKNKYV